MVDIHATEEEQWEALKSWVRSYGAYIVLGLGLGVGGVFGLRAWDTHRETAAQGVSERYEEMVAALDSEGFEAGKSLGDALIEASPKSPYAIHSALALSDDALDAGNTVAARDYLQWVINEGDDENMAHIARLRLARLQLFVVQNPAEAQSTLAVSDEGAFAPLYNELRGDVLVHQGNREAAVAAYQAALADWDEGYGSEELLKLKLEDAQGSAQEQVSAEPIAAPEGQDSTSATDAAAVE